MKRRMELSNPVFLYLLLKFSVVFIRTWNDKLKNSSFTSGIVILSLIFPLKIILIKLKA